MSTIGWVGADAGPGQQILRGFLHHAAGCLQRRLSVHLHCGSAGSCPGTARCLAVRFGTGRDGLDAAEDVQLRTTDTLRQGTRFTAGFLFLACCRSRANQEGHQHRAGPSPRICLEGLMAEGEGFEPPWGLRPPLISSQGRLASPASLRSGLARHYRYSARRRQVECTVSSCRRRISRKARGSPSMVCWTASPVAEHSLTTPPVWSPLSEAFSWQ